ncbi:Encoded by [Rhizoctonia solani]|uniref:Encoded by n=1 Tax=Rhizoctonia solani TaxID=456999 RepID=A0A8H7I6E9_9AGAM|nr:Encoded by [Rhizoctonia solani]
MRPSVLTEVILAHPPLYPNNTVSHMPRQPKSLEDDRSEYERPRLGPVPSKMAKLPTLIMHDSASSEKALLHRLLICGGLAHKFDNVWRLEENCANAEWETAFGRDPGTIMAAVRDVFQLPPESADLAAPDYALNSEAGTIVRLTNEYRVNAACERQEVYSFAWSSYTDHLSGVVFSASPGEGVDPNPPKNTPREFSSLQNSRSDACPKIALEVVASKDLPLRRIRISKLSVGSMLDFLADLGPKKPKALRPRNHYSNALCPGVEFEFGEKLKDSATITKLYIKIKDQLLKQALQRACVYDDARAKSLAGLYYYVSDHSSANTILPESPLLFINQALDRVPELSDPVVTLSEYEMLTYPRIIDPDAGVRVINKVLAQDRKSVNTSMASQDEGKSILTYLSRKKNNIVARLTSRSALDLSTSTSSIQPDAQSFPAGPVASQSRSAADDVVSSNSPLRHSDTDKLPATIDPLEGIDAATDTATVRVPQPITPTSPAIQALTNTLRTLHSIVEVFPPLQAAVGGLLASVEHVQLSSKNHSEMETLARRLILLLERLRHYIEEAKSSEVPEFLKRSQLQVAIIRSKQDVRTAGHRGNAEEDEEQILQAYRHTAEILKDIKTEANLKMWNIVEEQRVTLVLPLCHLWVCGLHSVLSHDVNRRACTRNTRSQILLELEQWSVDWTKPNVFWMNGMAGTGKTTIAYTFAESLKDRTALGASFFCTRTSDECRNVGRIVPTIAYQLARRSFSFRTALLGALDQEPDIKSQSIYSQCQRLIKDPLSRMENATAEGLVVVIDALDECSNVDRVRTILDVLFRITPTLPLKFFVTSRPEPDIRHRIEAQSDRNRSICVLHEIEKSLVQADIELYLRDELGNSVSEGDLIELASGLETCSYMRPRQFGIFEEEDPTYIDRMYAAILDAAVYHSAQNPEEHVEILAIVWTVVCTREPVDIDTLAALTGINATQANILLQPLYSVLHVSQTTKMIATLHPSFPDFMFDEARLANFYCDETKHSQLLAKRCFLVMEDQLRFNICSLETSFIPDSEVLSLKRTLDKGISMLFGAQAMGDASSVYQQYWGRTQELLRLEGSVIEHSQMALLTTWTMHLEAVSLAFSHDGSQFAIGFQDGMVNVNCAAFSPNKLMLVSGSDDGTILVQDAQTGSCIYDVIKGHESVVMSVLFSPNGKHILSGSWDRTTRMWDSGNGSLIPNSIKWHPSWVLCTAFSPNSKHIACGLHSYESPIVVYDASTSKSLPFPFDAHQSPVSSIAFSQDSKHLVTGHFSGELRVWSLQDGTTTHSPSKIHHNWITSIGFLPLGDKLVAGSYDRCVYIWDVENGYSNPCLLGIHNSLVSSAAFSPNGTQVASCSEDRTVKMWNVLDSTSSHTSYSNAPTKAVLLVAILPDGSRIAAAGCDKAIYMFNTHNGSPALQPLVAHTDVINLVAFSLDGRYLASGSDNNRVCLWDAIGGKLLSGPVAGNQGSILSVLFSPNSKLVVSASRDKTIQMWDVGNGTLAPTDLVGIHNNKVNSAAFSPNGKHVVSGCDNGKIRMWDLHTLSLKFDPFGLQHHEGRILLVTFLPDADSLLPDLMMALFAFLTHAVASRFLVLSRHIRTGQVWRVEDGAPACKPLEGHQGWINLVACLPNGAYIVAGLDDAMVQVWKVPGRSIVSNLSQSVSSTSDQRELHCAIAGGLTIDSNGWARNRNSQLVFWVLSRLSSDL